MWYNQMFAGALGNAIDVMCVNQSVFFHDVSDDIRQMHAHPAATTGLLQRTWIYWTHLRDMQIPAPHVHEFLPCVDRYIGDGAYAIMMLSTDLRAPFCHMSCVVPYKLACVMDHVLVYSVLIYGQ